MIFMPPRRKPYESESDYHARYTELYKIFQQKKERKERVAFIVSCLMVAALVSCGIFVIATYRGVQ